MRREKPPVPLRYWILWWVVLRLDARVTDLDEFLLRELRLERLDEARRSLAGGVGDDVELDRRLRHRRSA